MNNAPCHRSSCAAQTRGPLAHTSHAGKDAGTTCGSLRHGDRARHPSMRWRSHKAELTFPGRSRTPHVHVVWYKLWMQIGDGQCLQIEAVLMVPDAFVMVIPPRTLTSYTEPLRSSAIELSELVLKFAQATATNPLSLSARTTSFTQVSAID
jgi:hypothetical protein